jgi:hypothetical protein
MRARIFVPVIAAVSLCTAHAEIICDAVADAAKGRLLKHNQHESISAGLRARDGHLNFCMSSNERDEGI